MIETEDGARAAVQGWLDGRDQPAGSFQVRAVADIGPAWRAVFGAPDKPELLSVARVDKESGVVELDWGPSLEIGPSAAEGYAKMMESVVEPGLLKLGFTGTGGAFALPAPDHFATLSFQRGRDDAWVRVKFTANVKVVSRAEWDEWSSSHPGLVGGAASPDPDALFGVGWTTRLGVLSRERDHWWSIWAGFPTDEIAEDVLTAVREKALPAMRSRIEGGAQ